MMTREQARELSKNLGGTITLNGTPIYVWEADDPWNLFGWLTIDTVGVALYNPRAIIKVIRS
jgi:hypothetical protein